jgi:hypothetical protein
MFGSKNTSAKDLMSSSIVTPYSESEKFSSKDEERSQVDFTQLQNSDLYFNTLDKLQKNARKVSGVQILCDYRS